MKSKPAEIKKWCVTVQCVVEKTVFTRVCTEEQARDNPWHYMMNSIQHEMSDWEVIKVEADE